MNFYRGRDGDRDDTGYGAPETPRDRRLNLSAPPPRRQPPPPPPVQEVDEDPGFNLGDMLAQVLARKKLVAVAVAVGLAWGALYGQLDPNRFQARSLVQIEQRSSGVMLPSELIGELIAGENTESSLSTEFHIIRSRLILDPVVRQFDLNLQVRPELVPVVGHMILRRNIELLNPYLPERYARPGESIEVETFLVSDRLLGQGFELEVTGPDSYVLRTPDERSLEGQAGTLVKLDDDLELLVSDIRAPAGRIYTLVREPVRTASQRLAGNLSVAERPYSEIVDFAFTWPDRSQAAAIVNGIVESYKNQNLDRRSAELDQSIAFIEQQLPEVRASLEEAMTRLSEYRKNTQGEELSLGNMALLERAVSLEASLRDLEFREQLLVERLTPDHPDLRSLRAGKRQLEEQLALVRNQIDSVPETERELVQLTARVEQARELEAQLSSRVEQLRILKASAVANIRVLEAAEDARHIGPNRKRPIVLGALVALFAAAGWILLGNRLRRGVDDARAVEELGLSLFATIGSVKALRKARAGDAAYALARHAPEDLAVEALRGLRTGLQFSLAAADTKCVMMTSCAPADGKSFISLNLALVAAGAGSQVLLIDCDLRRGALCKQFGIPRAKPGLSDFLAGKAEFSDIIERDADSGLEFIGTGRYPPNPSELLATRRFSDLLSKLEAHYDLIILDAPPALAVTDPAIIGQSAGLSLLVVRHLKTTRYEILSAQKSLATSGVYLSGVIFNQFQQKKSRYGHYGTRYGYYRGGYSYAYKSRRN